MTAKNSALLAFIAMLWACDGGDGAGGLNDDHSPIDTADAGNALGQSDAGSAADSSVPVPRADAGDLSGEDAGSPSEGSDAGGGLIDEVVEYLTCKPDEINPIVDCITNTCLMKPDPISIGACLAGECAPLAADVNPKCKDCVLAGVSQDVAGLLENCLDTAPITGSTPEASGSTLAF